MNKQQRLTTRSRLCYRPHREITRCGQKGIVALENRVFYKMILAMKDTFLAEVHFSFFFLKELFFGIFVYCKRTCILCQALDRTPLKFQMGAKSSG